MRAGLAPAELRSRRGRMRVLLALEVAPPGLRAGAADFHRLW